MENWSHRKTKHKNTNVAIRIANNVDFKAKMFDKDKRFKLRGWYKTSKFICT